MTDLIIAMKEEIGNPDYFVGRKKEMDFFLTWCERAKQEGSKSRAVLARRKKGKTAILQRLYNILYSKNDPMLVPFYFRVRERKFSTEGFAVLYYSAFLCQFLGFQLRNTKLVKKVLALDDFEDLVGADEDLRVDLATFRKILAKTPELAWEHAQDAPHRIAGLKDIRIIQLLDEFQYMNKFIYSDRRLEKQVNLCYSYMGTAESKVAPLIVTGSYIGWLEAIVGYMTNRFRHQYLESLPDEEALQTVYNYAGLVGSPVTDITAPYLAEVAHNDPYYISQIIETEQPGADLTTKAGVRAAVQYETDPHLGFIASHWLEYVNAAFDRNQINAKKLVLYLARHGEQEFTRKQLLENLALDLSDQQLEERLQKMYMADLIGGGSSSIRYKGLGDPLFEMVFRKKFGEEIEGLEPDVIRADIDQQMTLLKRQTAWYKGLGSEFKVRYLLLTAADRGVRLGEVVFNAGEGMTLNRYASMKKDRIYTNAETSREIDIYARSETQHGCDLIIEVKNWKQPVGMQAVRDFIALKDMLATTVERKTGFLLYSEEGFTPDQGTLMNSNGIMYTTGEKLSSYEIKIAE